MDEMYRARYSKRDAELPCPLQAHHLPNLHMYTNEEAFLTSLGFLVGEGEEEILHYLGMTD